MSFRAFVGRDLLQLVKALPSLPNGVVSAVMKRTVAAPLSLLVALSAVACDKTASEAKSAPPPKEPSMSAAPTPVVAMPAKADRERVAESNNAFGTSLYGRLAKKPGNLAMSPLSITTALAMTWGGAKGDTEKEMRTVLHLSGEADATALGTLLQALASPGRPLTLQVANRLFGEKTFGFRAPFLERTATVFGAPMEPVDFKSAHDASRLHINAWVEDKTAHRIKDLLPPRAVDAETRMVLVNAIYFLADWDQPFKKEATAPAAFKVSGAAEKKVPTMHRGAPLRLLAADAATILELPYEGGETAMWIALPDAVDGLPALEAKLTGRKISEWTTALGKESTRQVDVSLPSFTVEPGAAVALSEDLRALGMVQAFDSGAADFSAIGVPPDPSKRLYVGEVFHKAFVKVDEKGTEAAAATAVVMMEGGGMPPKAVPFRADHPFLYFVVDKLSGAILFMGRVSDPSAP